MDRKAILNDVEKELKDLYQQAKTKQLERVDIDSRANVLGKRQKGVQVDIADDESTAKLKPKK